MTGISIVVVSAGLIAAGGVAALLASRWPRWAAGAAAVATVLGCGMGLEPSIRVLAGAPGGELRLAWSVPLGEFAVGLDGLSAFFLVVIFALCGLAAIYGVEYLQPRHPQKSAGPPWLFFNVLVAAMVLVVIARNSFLFLMAWEIMSLASFFLVTFEHEHEEVRSAGWTYLVATHLGTAFLLAMFAILGSMFGSMEFPPSGAAGPPAPPGAHAIFILALVGFGTKAGFMPFHVWLPEAHPAAPSHVSAVMSGVMIKTGIYGLLRTLTITGPPPAWWGCLLIAIGLASGVFGVLSALAQHDLKRVLAYSSVENIGIVALGLGTGTLGLSLHSMPMAVLGLAGALLHVLNHACFKGLLFLGAGSVVHGTGTRQMDRLGGLLKRMPWTGYPFLVGAMAICGLPPLNGLAGELFVYLGALEGVRSATTAHLAFLVGVGAGLALIGGLALACFTMAFGVVFLGEPRSPHAVCARECGLLMRVPMLILAAACAATGFSSPLLASVLVPVVAQIAGAPPEAIAKAMSGPRAVLMALVAGGVMLLVLAAGLAVLRQQLLAGRSVSRAPTWDCGYARPTSRMQYTASSFVQPLVSFFRMFLWIRTTAVPPAGYFPTAASVSTRTDDLCREGVYGPAFRAVEAVLGALRWLQHGRIQIYVLYIAVTLLVLLLGTLE